MVFAGFGADGDGGIDTSGNNAPGGRGRRAKTPAAAGGAGADRRCGDALRPFRLLVVTVRPPAAGAGPELPRLSCRPARRRGRLQCLPHHAGTDRAWPRLGRAGLPARAHNRSDLARPYRARSRTRLRPQIRRRLRFHAPGPRRQGCRRLNRPLRAQNLWLKVFKAHLA